MMTAFLLSCCRLQLGRTEISLQNLIVLYSIYLIVYAARTCLIIKLYNRRSELLADINVGIYEIYNINSFETVG